MFKGYLSLRAPSIQEVVAVIVIHVGASIYGVLLIDGYLCSGECRRSIYFCKLSGCRILALEQQ